MGGSLTGRPAALRTLVGLLVFQGVCATPPGLLLVVDPTGRLMQMPLSMLSGTIFHDFLIPGVILSGMLGLGAFFVAAGLYFRPAWPWAGRLNPCRRMHWSWTAAVGFGAALMIWIVVQVAMIGGGSWLQPAYWGLGLAIMLVSLAPSVRAHLSERSPSLDQDRAGR
jgi:hypothetical protein